MAIQDDNTQPDSAAEQAQTWFFIPTPGDHYSPSTGSANINRIHAFCECREAEGLPSAVVVDQSTYQDTYSQGQVIRADLTSGKPSGETGRAGKYIDAACGALFGHRPLETAAYVRAARAIDANRPGVVFIYNKPSAITAVKKYLPDHLLVLYLGNEVWRSYTRTEVKKILDASHRCICISHFLADGLRRLIQGEAPNLMQKIDVIHNGVNLSMFNPGVERDTDEYEKNLRVLFVGRIVPQKGVHLVVTSVTELVNKGVPIELMVTGSSGFSSEEPLSNYEQSLREIAREADGAIAFKPFQSRQTLSETYRQADVLVVPSTWDEPAGQVVLEGMASGLACISSNRGGLPETGGDAAVYFDPDDRSALDEALRKMAEDSEVLKEHKKRSSQHAAKRDWAIQYQVLKRVLSN